MESFQFKDSSSKLRVESILSQIQKNELSDFGEGLYFRFFKCLFKYQKVSLSLILIVVAMMLAWYDERQLNTLFQKQKDFLQVKRQCVPKLARVSPTLSVIPIFSNESFYKLKWIAILQNDQETVTWWKNQSAEVVSVKVGDYLGKEKIHIKRVDVKKQFLEAIDADHSFKLDFNQRERDEYKAH